MTTHQSNGTNRAQRCRRNLVSKISKKNSKDNRRQCNWQVWRLELVKKNTWRFMISADSLWISRSSWSANSFTFVAATARPASFSSSFYFFRGYWSSLSPFSPQAELDHLPYREDLADIPLPEQNDFRTGK